MASPHLTLAHPPADAWLPLFPLHTVLFPGGVLPLKVFETRYIDMVRDCMKRDARFGVVLIKAGQEVGAAAEPEDVGCVAHITQWDMDQPGLLMLRTLGEQRFRILEKRTLSNNRLEAQVEMIAADKSTPTISDVHVRCAQALKTVAAAIDAKGQAEQGRAYVSPFALPYQFDQSSWVANRWCEILPIPLKARQKLLELGDAESRLSVIYQYLQQHKIL
jgi:Lon protease-like protein